MIIFPTACEPCRELIEELATDDQGGVCFCAHEFNSVQKGVFVSIVPRGKGKYWIQTISPVSKTDASTLADQILDGKKTKMIMIKHDRSDVH